MIVLAYYWIDFFLGSWVRLWPLRARTGLVLEERGWWDIAVDPARYRLRVSPRLVALLGRALPQPDLALLVTAEPEVILIRKSELSRAELGRQIAAWPRALPAGVAQRRIDASCDPETVVGEAREAIVQLLEARATARLGSGWVALPAACSARWVLPRGPRRITRAALSVYQPVTLRGRVGWEAAHQLARLGAFRLFSRAEAPAHAVRETLSPYVPPGGTIAAAKGNASGRYLGLILQSDGRCEAVAKIALEENGRRALAREEAALEGLGRHLPRPLFAPRKLASAAGVLLLEPVQWLPRSRPWSIPPEVAFALGEFFKAGARDSGTHVYGFGHGDFAPWNLLKTREGWALIDWEAAHANAPPFFDLLHYLVQAHALLGRPSRKTLLAGLSGRGWVGAVIAAYAQGAHILASDAPHFFVSYLETSVASLNAGGGDTSKGLAARRNLRVPLEGLLR